ncbi:hypothetical protein P3X46_000413 [Hevea brasiliensis]|uniref:PIN domain-containing protein n=1 Tax=Hevea brasiliensis TaxID=3981 RepID=A0ABQ9NBA8_HEVBR|nr:hypothetical protein P3X46_000413 [Hevea brasiliensis]
MRVKKQKRHRRAVRFYTASFGFRQPFKILCDGTLVHNLIVNRVAPADNALSNILGGSVKLFTTSCVLDELKRLGNFYSESLQGAHKLMIARCDHENKKSAEACIVEILGENNPEHFFVATQDFDLRKKFREFVKTSEEQRSHATELEYKILKKRTKSTSTNKETGHSYDDNKVPGEMQPDIKKHSARRMDVKDRLQFKRKRAKKKKKDVNPKPSSEKEYNAADNAKRSRSRKRNRSHKGKNPAEMDSK